MSNVLGIYLSKDFAKDSNWWYTITIMLTKIIGLNWKMNPLTIDEVKILVHKYNQININPEYQVMVFVPSIYLWYVRENLKKDYDIGVQDIGIFGGVGAHTGEVSSEMVRSLVANCALIGHSETRQNNHLSELDIVSKLNSCYNSNLNSVLCVGFGQAGSEIDLELIREQVKSGIEFWKSKNDIENKLIIAFEPVGFIGTGKPLGIEEIARTVTFIKNLDSSVKVIYGGSVNETNFEELSQISILDGLLIGGMSLKPKILETILSH
jgi:triosephosphate isomerase (TIM)